MAQPSFSVSPTPAPSGFYFKSLGRLWNEKRAVVEAHPFGEGIGVKGGLLHAAVMFIDMSGFTKLTWKHRKHPQAALFIAHHFASLAENHSIPARSAISRTYVDKLIGDEVMLVIPGPRQQAMQDAADLARSISWHPLHVPKFGAHWGVVVLADAGLPVGANRSEAFSSVTVLGPTVNLASRVIKYAQPYELATVAQSIDGQDPPLLTVGLRNVGSDDIKIERRRLKGIGRMAVQRTKFRPLPGAENWIDLDDLIRRWIEIGGEFPSLD